MSLDKPAKSKPKISTFDYKKIRKIHVLHKRDGQTKLNCNFWLETYFWENMSKEQMLKYLQHMKQDYGNINTIISKHPPWSQRPPLHLPYIYKHEICFQNGAKIVLFQKYNYSRSVPSLISSFTSLLIPKMSYEFRKHHKVWEASHGHTPYFAHPDPRQLWERYKNFLFMLGYNWEITNDTELGPVWIVLNDITTVTEAIYNSKGNIGIGLKSLVTEAIHLGILKQYENKDDFEKYGKSIGTTMRKCYEKNTALIDVNLGNFILDSKARARLIDGELCQVFDREVPSHYKAMELALMMGVLFLETALDYCKTIKSMNHEDMGNYQQGLTLLITAIMEGLNLSQKEIQLAISIFKDKSSKLSHFFFKMLFSFLCDSRMIHKYHVLLKENLIFTVENCLEKSS
ncbi:MAG: hypothetical protein JSW60_03435 [Thermoplasmatales archaeon]|nr:MAG: hypothetical protein JSW60_03435 [Thermoplasmatales archaeon]